LLFFASVGDLYRCKKIALGWGLNLRDPNTADYDKRTPLHLAAAEGSYSAVSWLLQQGCDVNPIDRFQRTPLEDAVRGDHGEISTLLIQAGGKVVGKGGELIDLADSPLSGNVRIFTDYDPEWEVEPSALQMLEKIGEGEFGIVYKAKWYGTVVAVKVLKETGAVALGDFRTELNVLQKVHHPHTVQFLGAVTKTEPYMIVTEYMPGGSLTDVFKASRKLTIWRAVQLALDCARGLAYLHSRSPQAVIHRDLKPANMMLGGHKIYNSQHKALCLSEIGVMKIADFGLSKSLKMPKPKKKDASTSRGSTGIHAHRNSGDLDTRLPSITGPNPKYQQKESHAKSPLGQVGQDISAVSNTASNAKDASVGSASGAHANGELNPAYKMTGETGSYRYMAPEVFRHEPYNNKVDVYSFAMICYQLFECVPPFWWQDPIEAARGAAMQHKRPTWGAVNRAKVVVPERIKALVERCWHKDYEVRPEFEDIIEELEEISRSIQPTLDTYGTANVKDGSSSGNKDPKSRECCSLQ